MHLAYTEIMSYVYECHLCMVCYLKRPTIDTKFVPPAMSGLPSLVEGQTSATRTNFSRLRSGSQTLNSDSSSPLPFTHMLQDVDHRETFA